jgi:hypothetical protein
MGIHRISKKHEQHLIRNSTKHESMNIMTLRSTIILYWRGRHERRQVEALLGGLSKIRKGTDGYHVHFSPLSVTAFTTTSNGATSCVDICETGPGRSIIEAESKVIPRPVSRPELDLLGVASSSAGGGMEGKDECFVMNESSRLVWRMCRGSVCAFWISCEFELQVNGLTGVIVLDWAVISGAFVLRDLSMEGVELIIKG